MPQSSAVVEASNRRAPSFLSRDAQPFSKHLSGKIIVEGGVMLLFIRLVFVFIDRVFAIQVDQEPVFALKKYTGYLSRLKFYLVHAQRDEDRILHVRFSHHRKRFSSLDLQTGFLRYISKCCSAFNGLFNLTTDLLTLGYNCFLDLALFDAGYDLVFCFF